VYAWSIARAVPAPAPPPLRRAAQSAQPGTRRRVRSDDSGATWPRVHSDQALWGRGWYFERSPSSEKHDIVYVPNVAVTGVATPAPVGRHPRLPGATITTSMDRARQSDI